MSRSAKSDDQSTCSPRVSNLKEMFEHQQQAQLQQELKPAPGAAKIDRKPSNVATAWKEKIEAQQVEKESTSDRPARVDMAVYDGVIKRKKDAIFNAQTHATDRASSSGKSLGFASIIGNSNFTFFRERIWRIAWSQR